MWPLHLVSLCVCKNSTSDAVPATCLTVGITVTETALTLIQYRLLAFRWHHYNCNSTSYDAVSITSITVAITVPATALALMQYQLLPLQLTSLYLQQH